MKKLSLIMAVVIALSLIMSIGAYATEETKVVTCIGDSLTESTVGSVTKVYPTELQRLLGDSFTVRGLGVGGASLYHSRQGYIGTEYYKNSIAVASDYVAIMFGTNDSNGLDFTLDADKALYETNYKRLIDDYRALNKNVKIIMITPPPLEEKNERDTELKEQVAPFVEELSVKYGCEFINMYDALTKAHPTDDIWSDGTHFTTQGYHSIAKIVNDKIVSLDGKTDVAADFLTDAEVSVISRDALTANVFIAAYDEKGLVDVIDAGNQEIAADASTIIDTEVLEKTGATEVCMYVWSPDGNLTPLTEKVPVGARSEVTEDGIVIKGTGLIAAGNMHGILIKDEAGELVWASEQLAGVNGAYSYTVKLASGTYTVYTSTGGNAIVETLTVE